MFLPIVRISEKMYLDDLQNGKLFMRNLQYYQFLECDDLARSDPFDGAIPTPGMIPKILEKSPEISKVNLQTSRITTFNTYVSCFFGIKPHQIDSTGCIRISPDIANELRKFNCEYAIIIDLNRFAERLQKIVETEQPMLNFGHVTYLSKQDYDTELNNLLHYIPTSQPLEFLKQSRFANQQEFRISCKKNDSLYQELCSADSSNSGVSVSPEMAKRISNSHIDIEIGPIQEFSWIVKLSDLLEGKIAVRKLH